MKMRYIKPETEILGCEIASIIAASPETEWVIDQNGGSNQNIPGGENQDPDAGNGAKRFDDFALEDWSVDY